MINCIIIEDEPLALERTKSYVSNVTYLNLLSTFDNGIDAIDFINNNKIDLIFLDIEMDGLSGIELLGALFKPPKVIITTAYEKYAIKGYELRACLNFIQQNFYSGQLHHRLCRFTKELIVL